LVKFQSNLNPNLQSDTGLSEIGLEFNQSEERKPISSLVNFALISQYLIQSLVWYGLSKARIRLEIKIDIELDFDQSKQSSLNLKLVFFFLIGQNPIQS